MVLKVGDIAPGWSGKVQTGEVLSLSDFRGKKVVLYFYPKDSTPGCTRQACSLRDGRDRLREAGYEVVGVSCDGVRSHERFASKYGLNFPLVADEDKEISRAYGTLRMMWFPRRTTFVIDEEGIISGIIRKVDTKAHAEQILGMG